MSPVLIWAILSTVIFVDVTIFAVTTTLPYPWRLIIEGVSGGLAGAIGAIVLFGERG